MSLSRKRLLVLAALIFVAAAGGQKVYASGATAPQRGLAGATVSDVAYALSASGSVGSLGFTLKPRAHEVRVRFSAQDDWHVCSVSGAHVTCPLDLPVTALRRLQIARVV